MLAPRSDWTLALFAEGTVLSRSQVKGNDAACAPDGLTTGRGPGVLQTVRTTPPEQPISHGPPEDVRVLPSLGEAVGEPGMAVRDVEAHRDAGRLRDGQHTPYGQTEQQLQLASRPCGTQALERRARERRIVRRDRHAAGTPGQGPNDREKALSDLQVGDPRFPSSVCPLSLDDTHRESKVDCLIGVAQAPMPTRGQGAADARLARHHSFDELPRSLRSLGRQRIQVDADGLPFRRLPPLA